MVDRLGLGPEVRELKLGNSFTNPKDCTFHTIRYDFKPASIDTNKMATIDVGEKNEIQVNFPSNLNFQGSAKPYQKQCVLIVNHDTGEVTLEKLSNNISVKRQRNESRKTGTAQKIPTIDQFTKAKKQSSSKSSSHSSKSNASKTNGSGKTKSKTQNLAASFGTLVPKHSPLHASPNRKSPNPVRYSPNQPASNASLPNIGSDDNFMENWYPNSGLPMSYSNTEKKFEKSSVDKKNPNAKADVRSRPVTEPLPTIRIEKHKPMINNVGGLSDSSSSSSSSSGDSSDSSSDSDEPPEPPKPPSRPNGYPPTPEPSVLLTHDLQLSESGSDSD